jgi:excisionase family DNA binding protein
MSNATAPISRFYTIANLALVFDVCTRTIRNWIDRGELRAYRIGGRIRISAADLQLFLEQRR